MGAYFKVKYMYIPHKVYESLPYLYMIMSVLTFVADASYAADMFAIVLMLLGIQIVRWRALYRARIKAMW
jgi:hypothetical protein